MPLTTRLEKGFDSISWEFNDFIRDQKTSNALLVIATLLALYFANSQWHTIYFDFNSSLSGFHIGHWKFSMTNQEWINNGLMSLFFYLIGLEIKRELLVGELSSFRTNITIVAAAVGGMIFPALIYYFFNSGEVGARGWGIPMATDTAFAVGVLALLGKRVPIALVTFLTALAIFDDLGAVLVIAIFYIEELNHFALLQSGIIFLLMMVLNRIGVRMPLPYFIGGVLLWFSIHASGIHATITGIIVAITIPAKPKHEPDWFIKKIVHLLHKLIRIEKKENPSYHILAKEQEHELINDIERIAETSTTPLQRWEHSLQKPIALFVLPLFALSNAGIPIETENLSITLSSYEFWGIFLGLILGKSIGISLCTWLMLRSGLGILPKHMTMKHIYGIGLLGGMGFTMSIFIAGIGFSDLSVSLLNAKTAILSGSLMAGILGYSWLRWHSNH
jgi:Na+:H+ antiporter, NhaA family